MRNGGMPTDRAGNSRESRRSRPRIRCMTSLERQSQGDDAKEESGDRGGRVRDRSSAGKESGCTGARRDGVLDVTVVCERRPRWEVKGKAKAKEGQTRSGYGRRPPGRGKVAPCVNGPARVGGSADTTTSSISTTTLPEPVCRPARRRHGGLDRR